LAVVARSAITMPTPGCRTLTISRPSSSDTIEAQTNQAMVLAPDPSDRRRVAHVADADQPASRAPGGRMIILISFRKMLLIIDMYLATSAAVAASGSE